MSRNVFRLGHIRRKVNARVNESLVALGGNALDKNYILVALYERGADGSNILSFDGLGEFYLALFESLRTNEGHRSLNLLGEEQALTLRVNDKTCGHFESERRKCFGERGNIFYYSGILNALRQSESTAVFRNHEAVAECGKCGYILSVVKRGGNVNRFGCLSLSVGNYEALFKRSGSAFILLLSDEKVNFRDCKSRVNLRSDGRERRRACKGCGQQHYKLTAVLNVRLGKRCEEKSARELELADTANGICLLRVLVAEVCRGIAYNYIVLILDYVEKRYGVMLL